MPQSVSSADRSHGGRTLYSQVAEQVEALALAGPLGEETMLPPEWELVEQLGVSRGTLEKWIGRAMIPTQTVDGLERVERAGLEEIAAEVAALRRLREDNPAVLAEALTRLADRDPEFAGMEAQLSKSLKDIEHDELVPLRIPDGFGPEE